MRTAAVAALFLGLSLSVVADDTYGDSFSVCCYQEGAADGCGGGSGECVCMCDSTTQVLDDTIDFGDDNYLSPTPSPVTAWTTPSPVTATDDAAADDAADDAATDDLGLNKAWTLALCVEYCTLQYEGTHKCESTAADSWAAQNVLCSGGGRRSAAPTIAMWSFLVPAILAWLGHR